jgi:hypothetical protein
LYRINIKITVFTVKAIFIEGKEIIFDHLVIKSFGH